MVDEHYSAFMFQYNYNYSFWLNTYSVLYIWLCFWTVVLEKTLESPLDSQEIKPINPKGNQPWIFAGRADAEAEASILWPPDAKNWLGKDPDAGSDWGQEEKRTTEDEMVEWHPWLSGHEFVRTVGYSDEKRSLACCSSWVMKSHTGLSDGTTTTAWPHSLRIWVLPQTTQSFYILELCQKPQPVPSTLIKMSYFVKWYNTLGWCAAHPFLYKL